MQLMKEWTLVAVCQRQSPITHISSLMLFYGPESNSKLQKGGEKLDHFPSETLV